MKRFNAAALAGTIVLAATTANAEWPPRDEIKAPRGQEIQAPRE